MTRVTLRGHEDHLIREEMDLFENHAPVTVAILAPSTAHEMSPESGNFREN
jgi:hypothetical protein